jgi:hypothetical protein
LVKRTVPIELQHFHGQNGLLYGNIADPEVAAVLQFAVHKRSLIRHEQIRS